MHKILSKRIHGHIQFYSSKGLKTYNIKIGEHFPAQSKIQYSSRPVGATVIKKCCIGCLFSPQANNNYVTSHKMTEIRNKMESHQDFFSYIVLRSWIIWTKQLLRQQNTLNPALKAQDQNDKKNDKTSKQNKQTNVCSAVSENAGSGISYGFGLQ